MAKSTVKERLNHGWIRCNVIIEVLGKPAEYLDQVLKKTVDDLEKGSKVIEVIDKKFHEPTPIENMFSTFTELELLFKDMSTIVEFVFAYMPSNIEIIEPKDIKFNLHSANEFINMLAARMHQYDAIAKRMGFENKVLRHELEKLGKLPTEVKEMDKALKEQVEKAKKENKKED